MSDKCMEAVREALAEAGYADIEIAWCDRGGSLCKCTYKARKGPARRAGMIVFSIDQASQTTACADEDEPGEGER